MTFETYHSIFREIIDNPHPPAPYDHPDYLNYTKLNWLRMNRWLKKAVLDERLISAVKQLGTQQWIVITEPWCGDAAHSVPFIHLLAGHNDRITVEYELRDAPPHRINNYLTNGGKSIPKLIIKDEDGHDMAVWGPRPAVCQEMYLKLVATGLNTEAVKTELQKWYNQDKGKALQQELNHLLVPFAEAV